MARSKGSKATRQEVVAIDVGSRATKAVHLRRRGEAFALVNYVLTETPRTEGALSVPVLAEHLRSVYRKLKTPCRDVALVLSAKEVVLLPADLPLAPIPDLRRMIRLSPKSYLQQDLPDHVFDCYYRAQAKQGDTTTHRRRKSKVLVAGARRRVVEDAQDACKLAGLNLVALVPPAAALANAFRLMRDDSHPEAVALLDLGATHSTIQIVQHGDVLLSRTVAMGAESFADVLSLEGTPGGGEDYSSEVLQTRLQKAILSFAREVDASAGFYTSQHEGHISQLFVCGGTARSQMVLQMLESEVSYSCEAWSLVRHLKLDLSEQRVRELEYELPQMVMAVGGAVGLLQSGAIQLNLLADALEAADLRRRDPVRRAVWIGAGVVGLTLLYAGFLYYQAREARQAVANGVATLKALQEAGAGGQYMQYLRTMESLDQLHKFATNRFLFAPVLGALQAAVVDAIQLDQVDLNRRVDVVKLKPEKGSTAPPKEERFERVELTLILRNYGDDNANYASLVESIKAQPYLQPLLRLNGPPVMIDVRGDYRMTDADDADRGTYRKLVVKCLFEPRKL